MQNDPNRVESLSLGQSRSGRPHHLNARARCLRSRLRTGAVCILTGIAIGLTGCDSTDQLAKPGADQDSKPVLTRATASPKSVIEKCVQAYQRLTSYEDNAYVRLSYRLDGEPMVDQAPLSIGWDKQGRIGLRVYSVEAGPTDNRWRLKIVDRKPDSELTQSLERQTISRAVPDSVNFAWLLDDPLVAVQLAAGLAGFPPQLDLLLSPNPLSGLADDSAALSLAGIEMIDERRCDVVNIDRGGAAYQLWIEQATGLLRRVQIPSQNLASEIQHDRRVSELKLTIEIQQISVDQPIEWNRFAVHVRPEEQLVTHFVPQPPVIDTQGLGVKSPAFVLNNARGESAYRSTDNVARKATVLIWLADHPACQLAAEQLSEVKRRIETTSARERVDFVSVWAEPNAPQGLSFSTLAEAWSLPGVLTVDRDALGRDLFNVQEAPTLVVLDAQNRVQLRETRANPLLEQVLPQLLLQVVQGEDLAQQLIERNQMAGARHAAEIAMAAASDASKPSVSVSPKLPVFSGSYGTGVVRLNELSRDFNRENTLAATVDDQQHVWLMSESGQLKSFDAAGNVGEVVATPWKRENGGIKLSVAAQGDYFALLSNNGRRVQVFNRRSKQNTLLNLHASAAVVDIHWLRTGRDKAARLALIDESSQTILFDPSNHEQLSGQCPKPPLAIIGYDDVPSAVGGLIVLADRTVEPLELSDDSTLNRAVGQPASHLLAKRSQFASTLSFDPAAGPWTSWKDETTQWILARGWIAADEPALFMLDATLKPLWHYRMPSQVTVSERLRSVAKDPSSGQVVWGVCDSQYTVHLLRADGASDHFRLDEPLIGLALLPSGDRLILNLIHRDKSIRHELRW